MIFVPFIQVTPLKGKPFSAAGNAHRVRVEGDEFVALCGARFQRLADGAIYQVSALFRGQRCEACEAAST